MWKKIAPVVIALTIAVGFICLASWDLKKPYYGAIGDEYVFYYQAKNILAGSRPSPLSQAGVFGYHPVLDSYYQALGMALFGANIIGWKISGVFLASLTLFLFYFWVKSIFGSRSAFFATFSFALSHYLLALVHTGYNNIHALFPLVLTLFLAAKAKKEKKLFYFFLAGAASGLSFYTFYSARITPVILALYYLCDIKPKKGAYVATLAGFLVLFVPFLLTNGTQVVIQMLYQTYGRTASLTVEPLWLFVAINLRISFLGFFFTSPYVHHYVSGTLVDFITSLFFFAGLFLLFKKNQNLASFFFSGLFTTILITGGMFHEHTLAITRLFVTLPFIFALSGYALNELSTRLKHVTWLAFLFPCLMLALVGLANLQRFYMTTPSLQSKNREVRMLEAIMNGKAYTDKKTQEEISRLLQTTYLLPAVFDAYKIKWKDQ